MKCCTMPLRGERVKGHAATIEDPSPTDDHDWGGPARSSLLDFFAELTIYLLGLPDRQEVSARPARRAVAKALSRVGRSTDPLLRSARICRSRLPSPRRSPQ